MTTHGRMVAAELIALAVLAGIDAVGAVLWARANGWPAAAVLLAVIHAIRGATLRSVYGHLCLL
ncbi:MAG: hypothetical protein AB7G21_09780, partial [Dehalococcoidia bacterium]